MTFKQIKEKISTNNELSIWVGGFSMGALVTFSALYAWASKDRIPPEIEIMVKATPQQMKEWFEEHGGVIMRDKTARHAVTVVLTD